MDEIAGFWVGAGAHGRRYDVRRLAAAAGGYDALIAGGEAALVAGGVAVEHARAWVRAGPRRTRGVVLTLADPRYPKRLREVEAVPPFLCVEGDLARLDEPSVGVVGTRACTAYGINVARHLGAALAQAGVAVVSGLARGIDAAAHKAALPSGRTVAVLGHGLGHTAPAFHRRLRDDLLAAGALLVSEWFDEEPPAPWRFPQRNRWIAGLSEVVVVVEAPRASGALITAHRAIECGRDVYAVPGPLGAPASEGANALLAQGAQILVDVEQFVAERAHVAAPAPREAWLSALFAGASLDAIARQTGWTTAEVLHEVALLELRGEVVRLPGQRYAPSGRSP